MPLLCAVLLDFCSIQSEVSHVLVCLVNHHPHHYPVELPTFYPQYLCNSPYGYMKVVCSKWILFPLFCINHFSWELAIDEVNVSVLLTSTLKSAKDESFLLSCCLITCPDESCRHDDLHQTIYINILIFFTKMSGTTTLHSSSIPIHTVVLRRMTWCKYFLRY